MAHLPRWLSNVTGSIHEPKLVGLVYPLLIVGLIPTPRCCYLTSKRTRMFGPVRGILANCITDTVLPINLKIAVGGRLFVLSKVEAWRACNILSAVIEKSRLSFDKALRKQSFMLKTYLWGKNVKGLSTLSQSITNH